MSKRTIGLDFGTRSVKAAQLAVNADGTWTVEKLHSHPLPYDCMRDGQIREGRDEDVTAALRQLREEAKFDTNDVVIGMNSSASCFMRPMTVPLTSPDKLPAAIPGFLAAQNRSLDGVETLYSYTVLGEKIDETAERFLDLMVYTVRGEYATELANAATAAGFNVVGGDLAPLAALRAVQIPHSDANNVDVLVDIGAGVLSILVHHNGVPLMMTLDPDAAGDNASRRIADVLGMDYRSEPGKVEWHKMNDDSTYGPIAKARADYAAGLGTKVVNAIDICLRRSTQYDGVSNITLVGGGALLQGLSQALREALGDAPITYARLADEITGPGGAAVDRTDAATGGDYLVAIGLGTGRTL